MIKEKECERACLCQWKGKPYQGGILKSNIHTHFATKTIILAAYEFVCFIFNEMLRRIELRISYIKMMWRCRLLTARQERGKNIVSSRFLYHFISLPSFRWFPFISPSSKLITHGTCNFEQRETLHLSSWKLLTGSTNGQVTWHVCNWNSSNSLKSDIIEEKWCWFPFKTPFFLRLHLKWAHSIRVNIA